MASQTHVTTSSPGRICLFGEHLDYLGLPVIAAAISRRMHVEGRETDGAEWVIDKPDLGETDRFTLGEGDVEYIHRGAADFLRAAVNVVRRTGVNLPRGAELRVWGEVPIQAGTSSSSALQIAWISAILALAGDPRAEDSEAVAHLAYQSEVREFNGSGGMMDQFSSAMGGLIRIDPGNEIRVTPLRAGLGPFVLGHSLEPKDTQAILSRVQSAARRGAETIAARLGHFDWHTTSLREAQASGLGEEVTVTLGALRNRDLLEEGWQMLRAPSPDHARFGALLSEHHAVLARDLGISTPKIDRMLQAAIEAGALGGKINGSGGGGCMFAYAPSEPEAVAEAIRGAGGEAWVVETAPGLRVER